jgi:hypothetical protein
MSRGARRGSVTKQRRSVVLVFGEDEHDRRAIRHLAEGIRPDLRGKVEVRRQPLVLIKGATPEKARSNAQRITDLAKGENAARDVLAVLAHQDCDAVEPAHVVAAQRIEAELTAAGCPGTPIGVTPAWEIEAWWMLFPEAVGQVVQGWRDPDDWVGRDVGRVENAKEQLARAVQPRPRPASPPRDYAEEDSIPIASNIVSLGLLGSFQVLDVLRRLVNQHQRDLERLELAPLVKLATSLRWFEDTKALRHAPAHGRDADKVVLRRALFAFFEERGRWLVPVVEAREAVEARAS